MSSSVPAVREFETRIIECPCRQMRNGVPMSIAQTKMPSGRWVPDGCEICEPPRRSEDSERRSADKRTRDEILNAIAVPPRYRDRMLEDLQEYGEPEERASQGYIFRLARRFITRWPERSTENFPRIVLLAGPVGTGKTHMAWAIAQSVALSYRSHVLVTGMPDVVRDLREPWRDNAQGESERRRLIPYRNADLLVLDEVSRHAVRGEIAHELYAIIAYREQWDRPTIITTNETPEQLAELMGVALVDRANQWDGIWPCEWSSARPRLQAGELKKQAGNSQSGV